MSHRGSPGAPKNAVVPLICLESNLTEPQHKHMLKSRFPTSHFGDLHSMAHELSAEGFSWQRAKAVDRYIDGSDRHILDRW